MRLTYGNIAEPRRSFRRSYEDVDAREDKYLAQPLRGHSRRGWLPAKPRLQ